MDTARIYHDADGNDCTIFQMVANDPGWAANRIQAGEDAIADLARVTAERDRWQRLAQNESASAELSGLAATDHGAARAQLEAENDRLREALIRLAAAADDVPLRFYPAELTEAIDQARAALNGEGEG